MSITAHVVAHRTESPKARELPTHLVCALWLSASRPASHEVKRGKDTKQHSVNLFSIGLTMASQLPAAQAGNPADTVGGGVTVAKATPAS